MTAKELARKLGLSEAAVSFALNGRPGVSTKTRNRVKEAAIQYGLDVSMMESSRKKGGTICLVYYQKKGYLLPVLPFSTEVTEGVESACEAAGYQLRILHVNSPENLQIQLEELSLKKVSGILLFGTDMTPEDLVPLAFIRLPMVLLDNHFISSKIDSVTIANSDSSYMATNYLISRKPGVCPGYLQSSYPISNFEERRLGFEKALVRNGFSRAAYIHHTVATSIEGAYADMIGILRQQDPIASSYLADNDMIAIGAMKAFREVGYRIPEDIAIIGFDDIDLCDYTQPGLTTIHVPKKYMGKIAAERLLSVIGGQDYYPVNIRISTHLVIRGTV